jgi:carboxypeptidase C (cathepsin A)
VLSVLYQPSSWHLKNAAKNSKTRREQLGMVGPNGNVDVSTSYNLLNLGSITNNTQNISAYSGYLSVNASSNSALGYIFWGCQKANGNTANLKNYPTIMWLNGGPGSTSQMGNFIEFGPLLPQNISGSLQWWYNPWSWNNCNN